MWSKTLLVAALAVSNVFAQQSQVSDSLFQKIVRYTTFAAAAYSEQCPQQPFNSTELKVFNYTTVDAKVVLWFDNTHNELVLGFRGSAFPRNLDQDFNFTLVPLNIPGVVLCSGCQVHTGFQQLYNVMQNDVSNALFAAKLLHPFASIVVTGHSLGGALASLASTQFASRAISVTTYTFGEPRNGNAAWSKYVNSVIPNYFRVTHANDGVPQIPPPVFGFQHHGTEYWESRYSGNTPNTTYNCGGGEPTTCNAAQDPGVDPINGAHISYSNFPAMAGVLNNPGCGYTFP